MGGREAARHQRRLLDGRRAHARARARCFATRPPAGASRRSARTREPPGWPACTSARTSSSPTRRPASSTRCAAILLAGIRINIDPAFGAGYLLAPIAAVVIAGASLSGGLASATSTWVAALRADASDADAADPGSVDGAAVHRLRRRDHRRDADLRRPHGSRCSAASCGRRHAAARTCRSRTTTRAEARKEGHDARTEGRRETEGPVGGCPAARAARRRARARLDRRRRLEQEARRAGDDRQGRRVRRGLPGQGRHPQEDALQGHAAPEEPDVAQRSRWPASAAPTRRSTTTWRSSAGRTTAAAPARAASSPSPTSSSSARTSTARCRRWSSSSRR